MRIVLHIAVAVLLVASFIAMFALGDYQPGKGMSGAGGYGVMGLGAYLLVCALFARDFILYRLKVARITGFWGDDAEGLAHGLYGVAGVAFLVVGWMVAHR